MTDTAPPQTDADIATALDIARDLARAGVPIFTATPDAAKPTGFALPRGWQSTVADPAAVEGWRPGMALCAVMGHVLDLLDVDPRSGGDLAALDGAMPANYGIAATPSGGVHAFIAPLGVRSRDKVLAGIDVKSGDHEGKGRGFAFIAPTVRVSKVTGAPASYTWAVAPDLAALATAERDTSGAKLAELIAAARGTGDSGVSMSVTDYMKRRPWEDIAATLAGGRNNGVFKLASALRGKGGMTFDQAVEFMDATVWPQIDQTGHEFTRDEYLTAIDSAWKHDDGQLARMTQAADPQQPPVGVGVSEAYLADRVASQCLIGRYLWAKGLGWLRWDGKRWVGVDVSVVTNQVREYFIALHADAVRSGADATLIAPLTRLLTKSKIGAVTELAKGTSGVQVPPSAFDADPDLLNAGNGIVDLRTGELSAHDPAALMTKLAPVAYHRGAEHADWKAALEALPPEVREWYQLRLGQAITGHMTPDDVLVVQQGSGENGKTTVMAGMRAALGDYYVLLSHRTVLADASAHPTEMMDLRGARLALLEETPEERRLSVTRLKQTVGTPEISARHIRQDSVTFTATHSLFLSTNYLPVVQETDHGTWRRLACVTFPYRWLKPGQDARNANDRHGDPGLRQRVAGGDDGQHEALLAWLVAGAVAWYRGDKVMPLAPERVAADTLAWRTTADMILAYIGERLTFDVHAHVISAELGDDFNAWVMARGHRSWSRELFTTRFDAHTEVINHGVEKDYVRHRAGLSRPPAQIGVMVTASVPEKYRAWLGVRFQTTDDHGFEGEKPSPEPPPNGGPKTETDNSQNPRKTAVVPSVPRDLVNSLNPSYRDVYQMGRDTWDNTESDQSITGAPQSTESNRTGHDPLVRAGYVSRADRDAQSRAASQMSADKARAAKAAKIVEASGERHALPALVERDGDITPLTIEQARVVVQAAIARAGALTVDVETTGYPIGHADYRLRTVQLGDRLASVVFDADAPATAMVRDLLAEAPKLHAHSATADLVPLVDAGLVGLDAWERMHDTVIAAKLADPSSTGSDPGLKQLAAAVLGDDACAPAAEADRIALFAAGKWLTNVKPTMAPERSGWAQVDRRSATMVRYAASDVLDTAALAERLPWPSADLLDRERTVQRITARVAHDGLAIDGAHVAALTATATAARAAAGDRVHAYGIDNPGSATQVGAKLLEMGADLPRTKTGRVSAAKGAIDALRGAGGDVGHLVDAVLDYRHHDTVLGTFLDPYTQLVTRGDGRARPTVYTLGADTGRMSCVRPNCQQIPREGGIRACITADDGTLLISADFASVELRVAAALSGDANLRAMIAEGRDLHWEIARQVWGPDAVKADRYAAKRIVFGRLYGGGVPTLAAQAGVSQSLAASAVDVLDALTPGLSAWSNSIRDAAGAGRTQFPTYAGRVVHLSQATPHKAPNYCIQGTARELLVDALLRWRATWWGDAVLLPVHDEIVAVVPEHDAEAATAELVSCMETELYGVAIKAEASTPSYAWKDAT